HTITYQWYAEHCPRVESWRVGVFGVGSDIRHMDRTLLQRCSASNGATASDDGVAATQDTFVGSTRSQLVEVVAQQSEISKVRLTQTDRGLHNRIQHRLEVRWRSADDIEHIARRRLIFERFCELLGTFGEFARPCLLCLE